MIKPITTRGETRPNTKNELVNKHINVFTKFVKTIHFTKMQ